MILYVLKYIYEEDGYEDIIGIYDSYEKLYETKMELIKNYNYDYNSFENETFILNKNLEF